MQETTKVLLEETSKLLDALIPVVQRSIDTLQHAPNLLLQHLIQQEVEHQKDLLQRIEEMKERFHDCLNPPEDALQDESENDSRLYEITGGPSPTGPMHAGSAIRKNYPLAVTIPDRNLQICLPKGLDTLIKVIEELGIEKVRSLGIMSHRIPLVSLKDYDDVQQTQVGKYYIAGNTSTDTKVEQIKEIARGLNIELKPEQRNVR